MKKYIAWILLIFQLALPTWAFANSCVLDSPGGNLSTATWSTCGGTIPGAGDTATIAFPLVVDQNWTVGTSGAAGTVDVVVDHTSTNTGSIEVSTGVTFTQRGDVQLENATMTFDAGSTHLFDSSLASGTPMYRVVGSSGASQTGTKIIYNGTSGSHVTVDKVVGSGNGRYEIYSNSGSVVFQAKATFTDFNNLGSNSTSAYGKDAFFLQAPGSGQEITFTDDTFTNVSAVKVAAAHGAADIDFERNTANKALGSDFYSFWFTPSNKTTGKRIFTDNDASYFKNIVVFQTSKLGWTLERNILSQILDSGVSSTGQAMTSIADNMFYTQTMTNSSSYTTNIGNAGETVSRTYFATDTAAEGPYISPYSWIAGTGGTILYDGIIFDTSTPLEGQDGLHMHAPSSSSTINVRKYISLPNSRGMNSADIPSHGNKFVTLSVENSTLMAGNGAGSSTGEAAIYLGSGFGDAASYLASFRNNIVWNKTLPSSSDVYMVWVAPSQWPKTGTAQSGTTTSLVDTAMGPSAFPTTTNQKPEDSVAKLVITAGTNAGSTATVTGSTSTSITSFTPAMASPIDSTSVFKVGVVDIPTSGATDYNASFNIKDGTVYDSDGANGVTKRGYHNLWLTDTSTIGAHDIILSGSNETTGGPKFVDSSRNLATFDSAYLKNTATAWADSHSYSVGDMVSAQTSTFYGNAVINYRCITAHTSASADSTNGKPGSAASYRTNWEFASIYRIRTAIKAGTTITDATLGLTSANYIRTLTEWVRAGFAPKEAALKTGYGGTYIGAVAPIVSTGAGFFKMQ